jgi:hypothetical protein
MASMSAQYMRDYRATLKRARGHADRRLFQAGIEALRKQAIETFRRIGSGELTGYTAMDIMRDLKLSE